MDPGPGERLIKTLLLTIVLFIYSLFPLASYVLNIVLASSSDRLSSSSSSENSSSTILFKVRFLLTILLFLGVVMFNDFLFTN